MLKTSLTGLIFIILSSGCSHFYYVHDIPNFRTVDDGILYRGGQPRADDGWQYLKSLKIKTVVKLNFDKEGTDDGAVAAGLNVVKAEMPPDDLGQIFDPPTKDELHAAVTAMLNPDNFPIYVHCTHGQDRTGLITAMFRVIHDHWTFEDARNEMLSNGYHTELRGLEEAWENFKKQLMMPPNK